MIYKLAPSMMCCDMMNVQSQLQQLDAASAELLHIDIMDGSFVPNITLGSPFVSQLRAAAKIPLDLHFMVECPERLIDAFSVEEGDYVSIHFESTRHLQRVLQKVKDKGAKPLLAMNPATPIEMARDVLDDIAGVLLMTVNPGFAGQKMIPHAIDKIRRTRKFLDENGRPDAEIEVDGNVSIANGINMRAAGANIFVLGTGMQTVRNRFAAEDLICFRREVCGKGEVIC